MRSPIHQNNLKYKGCEAVLSQSTRLAMVPIEVEEIVTIEATNEVLLDRGFKVQVEGVKWGQGGGPGGMIRKPNDFRGSSP